MCIIAAVHLNVITILHWNVGKIIVLQTVTHSAKCYANAAYERLKESGHNDEPNFIVTELVCMCIAVMRQYPIPTIIKVIMMWYFWYIRMYIILYVQHKN